MPIQVESGNPNHLATLKEILVSHPTTIWNDYLSKRLHSWGREVDSIPATDCDALQGKCKELFEKVMVNPLDYTQKSPLTKPVLERNWIWEQSLIQNYLRHCDTSPYDGKKMEEIRPHTFAEKVIAWARGILDSQAATSNSLAIIPVNSQQLGPALSPLEKTLIVQTDEPQVQYFMIFTYCMLAQQDLCRRAQNILCAQIDLTSKTVRPITSETKSRNLQGEADLRQAAIEGAQRKEASFQSLEGTYNVKIEIKTAERDRHAAEVEALKQQIQNVQQTNAQLAKRLGN